METYDLLMLALLIGTTLFGAWKGFAWQLASLGSIVASFVVAVRFRDQVAVFIKAAPPWNVFAAMLILYVLTSLIIWVAFRLVSEFIDRLKLKEFDRQMGALFGFGKGVLLCVVITLFAMTLMGEEYRHAIVRSHSGYYIARLLDKSHAIMPEELHDSLEPYIHSLDERLGIPPTDLHDGFEPAPYEPPRGYERPSSEPWRDWGGAAVPER